MKYFKGRHAPRQDKEAYKIGKKWEKKREEKPKKGKRKH